MNFFDQLQTTIRSDSNEISELDSHLGSICSQYSVSHCVVTCVVVAVVIIISCVRVCCCSSWHDDSAAHDQTKTICNNKQEGHYTPHPGGAPHHLIPTWKRGSHDTVSPGRGRRVQQQQGQGQGQLGRQKWLRVGNLVIKSAIGHHQIHWKKEEEEEKKKKKTL